MHLLPLIWEEKLLPLQVVISLQFLLLASVVISLLVQGLLEAGTKLCHLRMFHRSGSVSDPELISANILVAILSEPLHFPMLPDKLCFDEYLNENWEPVCNLDWWLETFPLPNAAVDQVDWDWPLMGALGITYRVRSMWIISPERRIYYVTAQCTKPLSPYVWSEWCGEASRSRLVRNCDTVRPFSKGRSVIVDSFFMPPKPPGFSE